MNRLHTPLHASCPNHIITGQLKGRGETEGGERCLKSFCKLRRCKPLKATRPWRTAIRRYLSSLFLNHFGFIRRFEVVSDGIERRSGADIHKGHKTDSNPWCCRRRWLISTEHPSLAPLIHAPRINGYINTCIRVQCVSWNPFKAMHRWRAAALNPHNETRWYNTSARFLSQIHITPLNRSSFQHVSVRKIWF